MSVNAIEARQILYDCKQVACNKADYETSVRDAIVDYANHADDVGDDERCAHARKELERLDKQFGFKEE